MGHSLFPSAGVTTHGGQILTFGKEGFRRYNTKRAPGAATKRMAFGYEGEEYTIVSSALEAMVPDETANDALKGALPACLPQGCQLRFPRSVLAGRHALNTGGPT